MGIDEDLTPREEWVAFVSDVLHLLVRSPYYVARALYEIATEKGDNEGK